MKKHSGIVIVIGTKAGPATSLAMHGKKPSYLAVVDTSGYLPIPV